MTARFKSPFIHDFMMKHNPNYKIDSEWGVHKHVAALEKVVKHRRKEEERLQEERQREMDRLAAMNSVREEEQSYTPPQPREERYKEPLMTFIEKRDLEERGYNTAGMSESEIQDKFGLEVKKDSLKEEGYDTSNMKPNEIKEEYTNSYLKSRGYDVSQMDLVKKKIAEGMERRKDGEEFAKFMKNKK